MPSRHITSTHEAVPRSALFVGILLGPKRQICIELLWARALGINEGKSPRLVGGSESVSVGGMVETARYCAYLCSANEEMSRREYKMYILILGLPAVNSSETGHQSRPQTGFPALNTNAWLVGQNSSGLLWFSWQTLLAPGEMLSVT